jgi:maltose alpha-D-glucosyltransferase/alpha-amylase
MKKNWFILEALLLDYIKSRRWFRGKAREAWGAEVQDIVPLHFNRSNAYIILFQVDYSEGEPETYAIPVAVAPSERESKLDEDYTNAIIAKLKPRGKIGESVLFDGMVDEDFCTMLLKAMGRQRTFKGKSGEIITSPTRIYRRVSSSGDADLTPASVNVEQSNTSVTYGNQFFLKLYRRLEEGINPDLEIGKFLTENTPFVNISQVVGSLEYKRGRRNPLSLAILQSYVPNEGDAWGYTLDFLERYFDGVLAHPTVQVPPIPRKPLLSLLKEPPPLAHETIGPYLVSAQLLGQRTAELHIALASGLQNPDFAPEPYTLMYQTSLYQSLRGSAIRTLRLLRERLRYLPEEHHEEAKLILDMEKEIIERYNLVRGQKIAAVRIRCHGDYHLGQLLYTGNDFVIIDFEGEPARSLSERRLKRSPLRDVAGMLRSFHYAAHSAVLKQMPLLSNPEDDKLLLQHWSQYWYIWVSAEFLNTYLDIMAQTGLLPDKPEQLKILLDAFLLDKALYEVSYELNNRPEWVGVPLQGILQLMETGE